MKSRIMFIEDKSESHNGAAKIGWVTPSKTGKTLSYQGRRLRRVTGYKFNHVDVESGEEFWISGCKKMGGDRLYASNLPIEIDEDAREVYWREIRGLPNRINQATT